MLGPLVPALRITLHQREECKRPKARSRVRSGENKQELLDCHRPLSPLRPTDSSDVPRRESHRLGASAVLNPLLTPLAKLGQFQEDKVQ
jgi:hypothetical protein